MKECRTMMKLAFHSKYCIFIRFPKHLLLVVLET